MKSDILVFDVCECLMTDKVTKKKYFFGLASKSDVTQKISQEFLRGGIGMKTIGVIQSDKVIEFSVETVLHNDSVYSIQGGSDFETRKVTVNKVIDKEVLNENEIKLDDTDSMPKTGTTIIVQKEDNTELEGTYDEVKNVITATGLEVGEFARVIYETDEETEVLPLDSKKFPKNYEVELHTVAYDPETQVIVGDIYWKFNRCLPNGEINAGYEGAKSNGDSMKFTALVPKHRDEYGQYIYIKRK